MVWDSLMFNHLAFVFCVKFLEIGAFFKRSGAGAAE